jgi:hypothetical protein
VPKSSERPKQPQDSNPQEADLIKVSNSFGFENIFEQPWP